MWLHKGSVKDSGSGNIIFISLLNMNKFLELTSVMVAATTIRRSITPKCINI